MDTNKPIITGDYRRSQSYEFDGMIPGNVIIADRAYVSLKGVIGGRSINEGRVVHSNG